VGVTRRKLSRPRCAGKILRTGGGSVGVAWKRQAPAGSDVVLVRERRGLPYGTGPNHTPSIPAPMSQPSLDSILDALARERQRATYSAVAAVVGSAPRSVMSGRPRDPHNSWVVSSQTGQPTGYPPDQVAPELMARPEVLRTRDELLAWLGTVQ